MKSKKEIVSIIKQSIVELTGIAYDAIDEKDNLIENLGINSYILAELFVSLEKEFNLSLSEDFNLVTEFSVEDIAGIIAGKLR